MLLQILPFIAVIAFQFLLPMIKERIELKLRWRWAIVAVRTSALFMTGFFTVMGTPQYLAVFQALSTAFSPFLQEEGKKSKKITFKDGDAALVYGWMSKNKWFVRPVIQIAVNFAILYFGGFFDLLNAALSR